MTLTQFIKIHVIVASKLKKHQHIHMNINFGDLAYGMHASPFDFK